MARKSKSYSPGEMDYNGNGRKNCRVTLEWELEDGRFSMSGNIWNPRGTDCYSCGQNIDEIRKAFPLDQRVRRMHAIWKEWHLNDMNAGSPAQREYLNDKKLGYEQACADLAAAGLNPDPNYIHNGKPYAYGSAWLSRELPAEVIAEIQSWG